MTEVELLPDKAKLLFILTRPGKAAHRDRFDPNSAKQRKRICDAWGIDQDTFSDWCEQTRIAGGSKRFTLDDATPAEGTYRIRDMHAPASVAAVWMGPPTRFVKEKIPEVALERLAEWDDRTALCCLDIDYHDSAPPDPGWLRTVMLTRLSPKPLLWHLSKSGGIHAFYVAAGDFTAEELAACAALRYRAIDASAGLELKTVVRGPGAAAIYSTETQDTGTDFVTWLGTAEYDEHDREAWLESEGMELGGRYDHEKCPISPSEDGGKHRQPVNVTESGVKCFLCEGAGRTWGSRRPGFVSWATLLGSPSSGELGALIRGLVHWGHAEWVLRYKYGVPVVLGRLAYSAACKAYHAGKDTFPLVPGVFNPNTYDYARVNDGWASVRTLHSYPKEIQPVIACLPAARYVDAEGKVRADPAAVCDLVQLKDQSPRGYRNLTLIHGIRLMDPRPDGPTVVPVPNPRLPVEAHPRYVPRGKRMPIEEAWATLEKVVPRIDRTLVQLLICSFVCTQETKAGLQPTLFLSGPTGVAKSATCMVAAGIYGAHCAEPVFEHDLTRFRASIHEAASTSPIAVCNELLKTAATGRLHLSPREALDPILTLTEDSLSHGLYKGPVRMGRLPVLVITDTECPIALCDESQLARRIRHYRLDDSKLDWRASIHAAGVPEGKLPLIRGTSDAVRAACDAILSDTADTFLGIPQTFDAIADSLGVHTLDTDTTLEDHTPKLREFFRLVCAAEPLKGREAKLYSKGYKRISRSDPNALYTVYTIFADDGGGTKWLGSRRLAEKNWPTILGLSGQKVRLDHTNNGVDVFVRFAIGPAKTPTAVNESITDPSGWPPLLEGE